MNDIFANPNEVMDNIRESAKELGADIGEGTEKQPQAIPKHNCKLCWGKGWLSHSFPGNRGDKEVFNFYCRCVKFK